MLTDDGCCMMYAIMYEMMYPSMNPLTCRLGLSSSFLLEKPAESDGSWRVGTYTYHLPSPSTSTSARARTTRSVRVRYGTVSLASALWIRRSDVQKKKVCFRPI